MSGLKDHELMALKFLEEAPHCIGVIDTEEKMAAALVFVELKNRGLVEALPDVGNGPFFALSDAGRKALARTGGVR